MGNSSLRPVLAGDATNFQADLPKFILQSKIGNGKLMKTYLMRCESNSIVVKVYMSYPDEELRTFAAELTRCGTNATRWGYTRDANAISVDLNCYARARHRMR